MTISADRLAAIESAALAGCPTLPAQVVELARELREQQDRHERNAAAYRALNDKALRFAYERNALLAACQRLRGWAQSFLMDDHPAVVSVDDAIAAATQEKTRHG